MTTEADRINQLKYAMEKGAKNQARETARALLDLDVDEDIIVKSTGLSHEEVRSLKN